MSSTDGSRAGPPEDEVELVRAAQQGDAAAMTELLGRYEGAIYRFGLRFCKDPEDARDVLQETLLAAARGLPSFRGQASLGSWFYTIARSFCIKQRRRRLPTSALAPEDPGERGGSELADAALLPDEAAIGHELGSALQRALYELAAPYRDVLVLRDVDGLTAPEVAAALDIGVPAVKSRLHRARLALRDKLAPWLGEAEPPTPGCPDVLALFSRRLEGEVDAHLCEAMQHHVDGCPRCAAACDGLKQTLSLCAAGRAGPVPARVQTSVRRALRDLLRPQR
jgi:RNA polymerase sigma-70 factor (ECF subfamily)